MLPICVKKELQELHIVSVSLFVAVCIFIFIVFLQLCIYGTEEFTEGEAITATDFQWPDENTDFFKIVKSICMLLVAFAFTQNLFPVYSALKVKTNENCQKAVNISILLVIFFYTFLSMVSVFLFGKQIEIYKANVINNINREYQMSSTHWESFVLRALFMVVLATHSPFIFFSGKEALCIIIDEIDRRSVSHTLNIRVRELLEKE